MKRKTIWTKPPFWGSMLVFQGVPFFVRQLESTRFWGVPSTWFFQNLSGWQFSSWDSLVVFFSPRKLVTPKRRPSGTNALEYIYVYMIYHKFMPFMYKNTWKPLRDSQNITSPLRGFAKVSPRCPATSQLPHHGAAKLQGKVLRLELWCMRITIISWSMPMRRKQPWFVSRFLNWRSLARDWISWRVLAQKEHVFPRFPGGGVDVFCFQSTFLSWPLCMNCFQHCD